MLRSLPNSFMVYIFYPLSLLIYDVLRGGDKILLVWGDGKQPVICLGELSGHIVTPMAMIDCTKWNGRKLSKGRGYTNETSFQVPPPH
jgi:hypothetical protein